MEGIGVYAINPAQPTTRNYRVFYLSGDPGLMYFVNKAKTDFPNFLKTIPDGWVVLVSVMKTMKNSRKWMDLTPFYDAMEDAFFGGKSSTFRTLENRDAYVMTAIKGDPASVQEKVSRYRNGEESHEVNLSFTDNFNKYTVKSHVHNNNKWASSTDFTAVPLTAAQPTIDVIDDVTSWEEGDMVFFTSTDYDMEQAERGRIIKCDTCSSTQFKVDLNFKYTHFGEVEDRVDMRGEVGLLTRNVKVRGEMEDACTPTNGNCGGCPEWWHNKNCGKYPYDTFGGHVKFLKDFKNVHVEGLELENMGQQTSLGNYPLHFHMCEDVGDYPNPPYLKDNSIHDTFARCITIHGTHGVLVQDNVALDILGHCYFLEDGGEKNTVFDGNLGAVIRKSRLIPADDEPSVFWLTNPLVTMVNNVAAGSDHTGIWFVYPREPIQASKGKGFMKNAEQTAITKADNNVVHSCFIVSHFHNFQGWRQ
ncbi:hypothetical protein FSP39_015514 [Pinctada imbricata]|uniref:CEMIP beta-helix domain-containing protein n=1 Tax=Pinctada imbricata TaxID=66713 RepID=A0AA88YGI0_PINIB|nr:hypothetical protein FSP39_015514 [Pinctada imbricata]